MSEQTKHPNQSNEHKTHPGDPDRDHTLPPDQLDPSETSLPEGAQPTRRAFQISLGVFVIATALAVIGVLGAALITHHLESVLVGAVVGFALILAGALPVLIAYRLRVSDLEDLNRQEHSRR